MINLMNYGNSLCHEGDFTEIAICSNDLMELSAVTIKSSYLDKNIKNVWLSALSSARYLGFTRYFWLDPVIYVNNKFQIYSFL